MLLRNEDLDILRHFNEEDYRKIREIIIKMVLATDMAGHAQGLEQMKKISERIEITQIEISNNQTILIEENIRNTNKLFLMGQAMHFSDISNPCREWKICQRWTDLLFREFFA